MSTAYSNRFKISKNPGGIKLEFFEQTAPDAPLVSVGALFLVDADVASLKEVLNKVTSPQGVPQC